MRTSKSQLRWLGMWMFRILFFPLWILVIRRKHLRELAIARCKCTVDWLGDKITDDCPEHGEVEVFVHGVKMEQSDASYEEISAADKVEMAFIPKVPNWGIQLVDSNGMVYADQPAQMLDEEEGMILYAEFDIQDTVTIAKSRAMRRGKLLGVNTLNPIACTEHDIIKMRHALVLETRKECAEVEFKKETDEPIKNADLQCLRLMTANSNVCKQGQFPINEFALVDNGDMESLGAEVRVKFHDWYPKAVWIKEDGSARTTYNLDGALFKDIQKKADTRQYAGHAMYGAEYVFELETGELVTMFFGTKATRRAMTNIQRVVGHGHILAVKHVKMRQFEFYTVGVQPVLPPAMWMSEPITGLGNKHLWNIIQAVNKGEWASGKGVRFNPVIAKALTDEYAKREADGAYTKKKVKKIKKANEAYDRKAASKDTYASRECRW